MRCLLSISFLFGTLHQKICVCMSVLSTLRVRMYSRAYTSAVRPNNDAFTAHIALIRWQSDTMHGIICASRLFYISDYQYHRRLFPSDTYIHTSRFIFFAIRVGRMCTAALYETIIE